MFPAKYQQKPWPLPYVACKKWAWGTEAYCPMMGDFFSPKLQISLLNPPYGQV